jgi:hypothetical protein
MVMIRTRGYEFESVICKDSFNRRAVQYKNQIIQLLGKLGVKEDDTEIPLEKVAIKKAQATVSWYFNGHYMEYTYRTASRFVDNLYIVKKVLELKINDFLNGVININDITNEFSEGKDIEKQRIEAREALGVNPDSMDINLINKNYKILAKEFHPDMPNGDMERFKKINHAHKILKKELE